MFMSEDEVTQDLTVVAVDHDDNEHGEDPEEAPETPYICGHYVSVYEHDGQTYCGICGAKVA